MDGHDFATAAMKAGASVLVIAEGRLPAVGRLAVPKIVVPDVLVALEKLAVAARARSRAKVIAVTGSVGKTSTKEALRHVLSAVGTVHASDKSFNNHWGCAADPVATARRLRLRRLRDRHEPSGRTRPLVKMVRPHVAVITLIAAAHPAISETSRKSHRRRPRYSKGLSRTVRRCSTATTRITSF